LNTHQESEDYTAHTFELSGNKNTRTVSKSSATPPPAVKSPQTSTPAQRQQTAQPSHNKGKPQTIPETDDLESLMADLVPTAANKGRQSSMPAQQKAPANPNSDVSELDNLMANLYPPNIHGKKPTGAQSQQQRGNQRASVATDISPDLEDMISNLQTGYGMVEHQPAAPAAPNNRAQKTSSYVPNNPNNNPHAVYNPTANNPNNNPHAVYNPTTNNPNNPHAVYNPTKNNPQPYNPNPSPNNPVGAGRTNTNNQMNKPPPTRAGQSASRDYSALMDLSGPGDTFTNQQQPMRKPVVEQPKLGKGYCAGCRKIISSTQKIQAMGREYHSEHFQCSTCNKLIGNGNFFEKEGQPQCDSCYQSVFCSKCAGCGQPITTHCLTALSQSWHPDCFVCMKCHTPFNNASYFEKFGKPYCNSCSYEFNASRCRACNQAIRGNVINALGTWHPEHFVCQTCHQPFPQGEFYEVDGLPYCEQHYQAIKR